MCSACLQASVFLQPRLDGIARHHGLPWDYELGEEGVCKHRWQLEHLRSTPTKLRQQASGSHQAKVAFALLSLQCLCNLHTELSHLDMPVLICFTSTRPRQER